VSCLSLCRSAENSDISDLLLEGSEASTKDRTLHDFSKYPPPSSISFGMTTVIAAVDGDRKDVVIAADGLMRSKTDTYDDCAVKGVHP